MASAVRAEGVRRTGGSVRISARWLGYRRAGDRRLHFAVKTVRYIPGARMVATLTAGATAYSFRKFILFTIAGVTVAYTYVALLGYLGGDAFAHNSLKALGFSLGLAFTLGLVIETTRRIAVRRSSRRRAAPVAAEVTAG